MVRGCGCDCVLPFVEGKIGVKDTMGILVSRLNARLFVEAYGDGCYRVPIERLDDLATSLQIRPVVVMGGLQPGQR